MYIFLKPTVGERQRDGWRGRLVLELALRGPGRGRRGGPGGRREARDRDVGLLDDPGGGPGRADRELPGAAGQVQDRAEEA